MENKSLITDNDYFRMSLFIRSPYPVLALIATNLCWNGLRYRGGEL